MDQVADAILLVDHWREELDKDIQQGKMPGEQMLGTMANLLERISDLFKWRLMSPTWESFYRNMREGVIPDDCCSRLLLWEKEAYRLYLQNREEEGICNICKGKVKYWPSAGYFQKKQKEHGFLYSDAVVESLSRERRTCPVCQSMDRERMISLFLDMLQPARGKKLKVLHIAPSWALNQYLMGRSDIECDTADLYMENVSFRVDIQNMAMVGDESYDVIICSHILEHVEDDRKAMHELRRVLREDGVCIFLVPLIIGLDRTDEETGLTAGENWKRFGQDDHVRLYGREDFINRLIQAGYLVHVLRADYFGENSWRQNGLSDIHCLYAATKKDIGLGVDPYQVKDCTKDLVSVIIPTWNRGRLIGRSVRSVLSQTYKNIEVIVVDDASADNTEAIIRKIDDDRLRYIRLETNGGANHARNVGVKAARGKYVAFNDSDDEWLPEKLEKQMRLMCQPDLPDVGCVYCRMVNHYDDMPDYKEPKIVPWHVDENMVGNIFRFLQGNMFISTQTLLLKKEVIEEVGYFDEKLRRLQDWELLLRIAQKYKFMLVQEKLVNTYMQKDSISTDEKAFIDTVRYVIRRYDMAQSNVKAYVLWVNVAVGKAIYMSEEYKRKLMDDIKKDEVFSGETLQEMYQMLRLD